MEWLEAGLRAGLAGCVGQSGLKSRALMVLGWEDRARWGRMSVRALCRASVCSGATGASSSLQTAANLLKSIRLWMCAGLVLGGFSMPHLPSPLTKTHHLDVEVRRPQAPDQTPESSGRTWQGTSLIRVKGAVRCRGDAGARAFAHRIGPRKRPALPAEEAPGSGGRHTSRSSRPFSQKPKIFSKEKSSCS